MDHTSPLFEPEVEIGLSAMILLRWSTFLMGLIHITYGHAGGKYDQHVINDSLIPPITKGFLSVTQSRVYCISHGGECCCSQMSTYLRRPHCTIIINVDRAYISRNLQRQ